MALSKVMFELSYKGSTQSSGWNISVIDVKLQKVLKEISAHINKDIPATTEQFLDITLRTNSGNPIMDKVSERTVQRIAVNSTSAKTIELTARIFQTYENRDRLTMYPNGTVKGELRARREDKSIFIREMPEFEPGKCYRIKVVNTEGTLNASFVLVEEKISDMEHKKQKEQKDAQDQYNLGLNLIHQGVQNLFTLNNLPDTTHVGKGLETMIKTQMRANQPNANLDTLSIPELRTRFDAAQTALQKAREEFDKALKPNSQSDIMKALSEKQAAQVLVMELANALTRKGEKV